MLYAVLGLIGIAHCLRDTAFLLQMKGITSLPVNISTPPPLSVLSPHHSLDRETSERDRDFLIQLDVIPYTLFP